jgi:hypothetical protein
LTGSCSGPGWPRLVLSCPPRHAVRADAFAAERAFDSAAPADAPPAHVAPAADAAVNNIGELLAPARTGIAVPSGL